MPKGGSERIVRRGENARRVLERLESARLDALSVLERALELAELHAVPEEPASFAAFTRGPLLVAMREVLGDARATALVASLGTERAASPSIAPASSDDFVVVLASEHAARSRRIRARLGSMTVREAPDLTTLLALIEDGLGARTLVVFDGQLPGLHGPILLTLTRLLPASASVIFRGDPPSGLFDVSLAWATLPADATEEDVALRCLAEARADEPPQKRSIADRPMLVLVEPDDVVRALMTRRFEHEGYLVIGCADALSALEKCIDHEPDVLVAPREMSGLDGGALARLVRGRLGEAGPAIVLRGAVDPTDARAVRSVPMDARFADLLQVVRKLAPARRL